MQVQTKKTLSLFWHHARKYRGRVFLLIASVLILTAIQTYTPILYRDLIDLLTNDKAKENIQSALWIVAMILILNFARNLFWRGSGFVNNYFQSRTMADLTNTCYEYLQRHSFRFFASKFVGSLVTKVKRYERAFETIADQFLFDLGRSSIDTAMVLAVLLIQYRVFGLSVLGWVILFLFFSFILAKFKLPYDIKRAQADTSTTGQLADSITNNSNIKLFSSYRFENQRFRDATEKQFRLRKKSWNIGTIGDLIQSIFMFLLEFGVVFLSVKMWYRGELTIGDITLLQAYTLRIIDKLWNTGRNIRSIYEALADANEMTEILTTPLEVIDRPNAPRLLVGSGVIQYSNVSFAYHNEKSILNNFSLKIKPGERIALVGPSGGGKSTILKLLLRFQDVASGKISIDGQNIATVTQDSLRNAISLVPQEPILFHRSLLENIRYAKRDASDADVERAAKLAHAHEFIISFKDGYDTLVGERGIKLSGGERQRVAIARAILKNAPILLLDEATSSLDSESEQFIQESLRDLMRGRTTIVIAHRLSTIMQMDRIVVIEGGKIIEEGKHEELVKAQQGLYQRLWEIQAGGFAG